MSRQYDLRQSYQSRDLQPETAVNSSKPTFSRLQQSLIVTVAVLLLLFVGAVHCTSSYASIQPLSEASSSLKAAAESLRGPGLCDDPEYTKITLKRANEMTMAGLFDDVKGAKRFEASDVIAVGKEYFVVYDNMFKIGRIDRQLEFHSKRHELLEPTGTKSEHKEQSDFEGLTYVNATGTLYVVVENAPHDYNETVPLHVGDHSDDSHPWIEEIQIPAEGVSTYTVDKRCIVDHSFRSAGKGLEGVAHVHSKSGQLFLLGLCEGNDCDGGAHGKVRGQGRVIILRRKDSEGSKKCKWETVEILHLPEQAYFQDYSAMAMRKVRDARDGNEIYQVAISSQEDSMVWLGELHIGNDDGKGWEFRHKRVVNFPRGGGCEVEYCNIEGIDFIGDNMLVAVSDKMKGDGKQPARCLAKDQSIHAFVIP